MISNWALRIRYFAVVFLGGFFGAVVPPNPVFRCGDGVRVPARPARRRHQAPDAGGGALEHSILGVGLIAGLIDGVFSVVHARHVELGARSFSAPVFDVIVKLLIIILYDNDVIAAAILRCRGNPPAGRRRPANRGAEPGVQGYGGSFHIILFIISTLFMAISFGSLNLSSIYTKSTGLVVCLLVSALIY